ncbi:hypothetical protein QVD17_38959 [Tagetes erecta]|uniref:Biotin carboxyl carrier protein of acetyl-CoA carboxylase n=1 Tax=Tagetes erecta TaxID=13708 RepID=A0AAD8JMP7_TARER|nr:hypothetical protein QVD17_38959 [Tagetes erecta]
MSLFVAHSPKTSMALFASQRKGRAAKHGQNSIVHFKGPLQSNKLLTARNRPQPQGFGTSKKYKNNGDKIFPQLKQKSDPEPSSKKPVESTSSEVTISAFMNQVLELVRLVESSNIAELELKQQGCEVVIRKKEAVPPPPPTPPMVMMQSLQLQAMYQSQPLPAPLPPASPSSPASATPAKTKSSHPPFKCPMAGTFYRSPAPGALPFVKVGDKVKKGQVVCIIEAMKLMNEIEADQSGTVVDILAEDGKPVSLDTPLLVIEP